jgi:hypothetical protein
VGAAEAYIQGGAALLLVIVVTAVIAYLRGENKRLSDENKALIKASLDLLQKNQERDAEELRAFREAERRRREGVT